MKKESYIYLFKTLELQVSFQVRSITLFDLKSVNFFSDIILKSNLPYFEVLHPNIKLKHDITLSIGDLDLSNQTLSLKWLINGKKVEYVAELRFVIEDFQKILLQVLALKCIDKNIFTIHAASYYLNRSSILLPAYSGGGKSTLSVDWLNRKRSVLSSEVAFIKNGKIIEGNKYISIKKQAIEKHLSKSIKSNTLDHRNYLIYETQINPSSYNSPIVKILFPKITNQISPISIYESSALRSKMFLYELSFWILNGGFLLGGHKHAGLSLASQMQLEKLAHACDIVEVTSPLCI